jgi:hypothetical protein
MKATDILKIIMRYSSVADLGCLSRIRIFSIPNPSSRSGSRVKKISGSRIQIRIRIKEFKFFTQKLFLSSRKYDPKCSSWIRIPDPELFLPIPDTGSATLRYRNYVVSPVLKIKDKKLFLYTNERKIDYEKKKSVTKHETSEDKNKQGTR